ncbi:MAG: AmmeMemoRadiSam system radical SAM enzyme [Lentisphaeria bacterium]|jgi:pyruvate formate lyase activating enzyme|nr:AmmeMemoRadiSam system radical SAM enzyme [Lentisphaeria bacterium]
MSSAQDYFYSPYFEPLGKGELRCTLCPRQCRIKPGDLGRCLVRRNVAGRLQSLVYGHPAALQVDPIEKKPLHHWKPGSRTFSLGTFGCNMSCLYCQNEHLSRSGSQRQQEYSYLSPADIVRLAKLKNCASIAFTYNEPTVFQEYALHIAKEAKKAGLGTVLVSNGWIMPEARQELYEYIDAANIDIKAFSEEFYRKLCGASLADVLESCRHLRHVSKSHLEITNLVIPGYNDEPELIVKLLDWVGQELGKDTPLHFSAYYPAGGFEAPPTSPHTLRRIENRAKERGFSRISLGNLR